MALDNYANLKASIQSWSHRGDVTGLVDDFILLAETEMYSNPDATLRLRSMEQSTTVSTIITDDFVELPAEYLEYRRVSITVGGVEREMEYKDPEQMNVDVTRSEVPFYFTITDKMYFEFLPDAVYVINFDFYGRATALSASNTTNAILTEYPNIYLYGALRSLQQWAMNAEEENLNYQRLVKAIQGANKTDRKGRYGPNPKQRVNGFTP